MLVLDGAYLVDTQPPVFRRIEPPSERELQALVELLAERIGRALERQGVLVRDAESSFLAFDPATGGGMDDLIGHSITYRVAVGPRAGQKVFTLQTVPSARGRAEERGGGVRGVLVARRDRRRGPPAACAFARSHGVLAPHAALRAAVRAGGPRAGTRPSGLRPVPDASTRRGHEPGAPTEARVLRTSAVLLWSFGSKMAVEATRVSFCSRTARL